MFVSAPGKASVKLTSTALLSCRLVQECDLGRFGLYGTLFGLINKAAPDGSKPRAL